MWTLLFGSVISITSNILLVPTYGFLGACYTSILTHATLALILLPLTAMILPFALPLKSILQWTAYAVLMTIGLSLIAPYLHSSLMTAIGIVVAGVYIAALILVTGIWKSVRG